jgi:hypothetical protein
MKGKKKRWAIVQWHECGHPRCPTCEVVPRLPRIRYVGEDGKWGRAEVEDLCHKLAEAGKGEDWEPWEIWDVE